MQHLHLPTCYQNSVSAIICGGADTRIDNPAAFITACFNEMLRPFDPTRRKLINAAFDVILLFPRGPDIRPLMMSDHYRVSLTAPPTDTFYLSRDDTSDRFKPSSVTRYQ